MPSKLAKFCREKGVLITMYEEKPRKRRESPSQPQPQPHHHHHYHHQHHYLHHASEFREYNRRADLLRYSERLRESARPVEFTLLQKNPTPPSETIAVLKKKKSGRTVNCLGDCKLLIPSFMRSLTSPKGKKDMKKKKKSGSTTNKMKALMKSFQEQKNRGFIPKLFSRIRKRR